MWLGVAALALGSVRVALSAEPVEATCVEARATPLYQGVGWTHFVDVDNACDRPVACSVATTVDPEPTYRIELRPTESTRVRTRYGSNTPVFGALVRCSWLG